MSGARSLSLSFHPLTPARWPDLVSLFGPRGAYGGCWCMWWRMSGPEYRQKVGAGTQRDLRRLTTEGKRPGILAYDEGRAVGWCSVAPRDEFMTRLSRWSPFRRARQREDGGARVWSIVCFFVDRAVRGRGVAESLLQEAVRYAAARGAAVVEAYPEDTRGRRIAQAAAYTGTVQMFRRAGFREVERAYPARPVMRRRVRRARTARETS